LLPISLLYIVNIVELLRVFIVLQRIQNTLALKLIYALFHCLTVVTKLAFITNFIFVFIVYSSLFSSVLV
jgi:hypothetical protein